MESQIKNSRILVTGGAGFIGSNLCEKLLLQDNEVICLDNFSTGHRSNIERFLGDQRFMLINGDIRDRNTCSRAMDGIDFVLHHAALGSVPRSVADPMTSTDVNVTGFVNILFAAKESKVKRFIYASSSSVYGDQPILPKVENQIGKPLSPYAITKWSNEVIAMNFSELYGIETVGLRYFNVFGPWQDPNGPYAAVIPKWILLMLKGEKPVIHGDGNNSRDFTYIDNVVSANQLAAVMNAELNAEQKPTFQQHGSVYNNVFNIACGKRTDLNQLFYFIREGLIQFESRIQELEPVYGLHREGDIPHSLADISKAKQEIGYQPVVGVKEGLKKTCEWFASRTM